MKKITVTIKNQNHTYPIFIGKNLLEKLDELIDFTKYSKIIVVTDKHVEKMLLKQLPQIAPNIVDIVILPFGERAKTIETAAEVWREMAEAGCDRKSLIINVGGGLITDLGGFAASTYMRGIDFINVPTSLLSQVDASVGGKTAVNFYDIKNLIGTFNQPAAVVIDVNTLSTLPQRDIVAAFGEIIKHGVIGDKKYFQFTTSKHPLMFTKGELITIIEKSCKLKANLIAKDPKEQGLRKLLNFGHTIGHALEILSQETDRPLLHGEAVAVGMVAEAYISVLQKLLKEEEYAILVEKLKAAELPIQISHVKKQDILEKILTDKKTDKGNINWTLIKQVGSGVINQTVSKQAVEKALEKILV